ncbi:MAG: hypothetical protein HUJ99_06940 [Bacteroidaceae bacterium]|nr:hypothetical protein [Bacteroidaceae bacterium]
MQCTSIPFSFSRAKGGKRASAERKPEMSPAGGGKETRRADKVLRRRKTPNEAETSGRRSGISETDSEKSAAKKKIFSFPENPQFALKIENKKIAVSTTNLLLKLQEL